jgi:N-acetylglutamate synthase-like GNAT family acetyltransferase
LPTGPLPAKDLCIAGRAVDGREKGADVLELAQIDYGSNRYRELVEFRRQILRTPLGLDFTPRQLTEEQADIHIAAYFEGELVGCVVLTDVNSSVVRLRQMAVRPDHQGRGVGAQIVSFAEKSAAERGYREIILNARDTAVHFYERAGYAATGQVFTEVTIPHRRMVKRLAAGG